jgi:glutamate decarboxylase
VRQGVSRDLCSVLIDDMRDAVAHFDKHPVSVGMSAQEAGSFNHL